MENFSNRSKPNIIKYSIATSWDNHLLDEFAELNEKYKRKSRICEIFGSLQKSITGSARPSNALPFVSKKQIESHVKKAHALGLEVNYLINSSCVGSKEFSLEWRQEFLKFVKWLKDINVNILTIAIPYLIEIIKNKFPDIRIKASILCGVNSPEKARRLAQLGVERITLDFCMPRYFRRIKEIREAVNCDLEIYANTSCLFHCHEQLHHFNIASHGSQIDEKDFTSYPYTMCTKRFLKDPSELIKSPWIRPEDTKEYAELGIDFFKLAGRGSSTKWLSKCAQAYISQEFKGNLFDLIGKENYKYRQAVRSKKGLEKPLFFINNKGLNGFIDFIKTKKEHNCSKCNYCERVAKKVVKIDSKRRENILKRLAKIDRKFGIDSYE